MFIFYLIEKVKWILSFVEDDIVLSLFVKKKKNKE